MRLRWINPIFWFVLSVHTFYTLGHQSTFSTIPWFAAFIGGSSEGTVIPAIMVAGHIYAGHIWLGLTVPLLSLAPLAIAVMFPSLRKNKLVFKLFLLWIIGVGLFRRCFSHVLWHSDRGGTVGSGYSIGRRGFFFHSCPLCFFPYSLLSS